ncbi:MAG: hypothetical protein A3F14_04260 [Gammaproteobacteria bacterium RIFCSPHIGHO2_12_FULL_43_28]|nr:MAG: hypothetical protein A3F14_04260 [Gammaproteobacteria bacterium RIFCSPHIGHO2_12_FULL_43_28]
MVHYRRLRICGGCYFFTIALKNRKLKILTQYARLLHESWHIVKNRHPFETISYVILPDHLHFIWQMPEHDYDFSTRIRLLKAQFTRKLIAVTNDFTKNKRGEYNIWPNRYWEHMIRNEKDYENHVNYIHYNPVKHGLVKSVRNWPYSSFHRYVKAEILPAQWGAGDDNLYLPYDVE